MLISRPLRVLIVDDTPIVRLVVRRALAADERFEVIAEAANGREAVDHTSAHLPDLVLLDLAMPEMDGLEALPLILTAAPSTRVIVLSAFSPDQMAHRAVAAGALAYLEKNRLATELVLGIVTVFDGLLLDA